MVSNSPRKYKKEMCASLVQHMSQGYSYITWGVSQNPRISSAQMFNWESMHPEWFQAKKEGYSAGLKFYETLLASASVGIIPDSLIAKGSKKLDITAIIFALKTRFHREYGEIAKIDHTTNGKSINVNFVTPSGS